MVPSFTLAGPATSPCAYVAVQRVEGFDQRLHRRPARPAGAFVLKQQRHRDMTVCGDILHPRRVPDQVHGAPMMDGVLPINVTSSVELALPCSRAGSRMRAGKEPRQVARLRRSGPGQRHPGRARRPTARRVSRRRSLPYPSQARRGDPCGRALHRRRGRGRGPGPRSRTANGWRARAPTLKNYPPPADPFRRLRRRLCRPLLPARDPSPRAPTVRPARAARATSTRSPSSGSRC